ncbi:hypothetical protein SAMN05216388_105516 [Halorientalis persicus]|uniref:Uncharacterized protein n=1 Tax=Halorientalis persicus TaxID=1367881 RepID=A0A1H8WD25_9EURY|nr:hypothetical protein [Halorientalis persicus]SEP25555.1 hypothetical protein SAMN05216388_105516 [Halorientalis persicus]
MFDHQSPRRNSIKHRSPDTCSQCGTTLADAEIPVSVDKSHAFACPDCVSDLRAAVPAYVVVHAVEPVSDSGLGPSTDDADLGTGSTDDDTAEAPVAPVLFADDA